MRVRWLTTIDDDVITAARMQAAKEHLSLPRFVEKAIRLYLEQQGETVEQLLGKESKDTSNKNGT